MNVRPSVPRSTPSLTLLEMSIRLSDDEAWSVLEQSHTGILTTLRADGAPIALPIWFVVVDRTICFTTFDGTKKVRRIARDPRGSFLVESGLKWAELRAVHLSGSIEEISDPALIAVVEAAWDKKYQAFRTPQSEMPAATQQHYARKRPYRLVPHGKLLTWDNSRIATRGST